MVAGLEEPTGGWIAIAGKDVTDVQPRDRDIAMVFQSYALYPHMTVFDNLAFGLKQRKTPKTEITSRVAEVARDARHRPPAETASRANSPAANGSAWRWAGRLCGGRGVSSWTNR